MPRAEEIAKDVGIMDAGSTGSLKQAEIAELSTTPFDALPGLCGVTSRTVGPVASTALPVEKFQITPAIAALPARSFTPGESDAVYVALVTRLADGLKLKELPPGVRVPFMVVPLGPDNTKIAASMDAGATDSLNATETMLFTAAPVEPFAGLTAATAGGVVSGRAPVVKLQAKLPASAFPARSCAPVVSDAVYVAE